MLELVRRVSSIPVITKLNARSALGAPTASEGKLIVEAEGLHIREEAFLRVFSVRRSLRQKDLREIEEAARAWQLDLPSKQNATTGTADCGCSWIEPNAWLMTSIGPKSAPAGGLRVLVTDLSDRFAAFRVKGRYAVDVVAAGCDAEMFSRAAYARTRFASLTTAMIQRWSEDDYRFLVDVSIASVFAQWLRQTASNIALVSQTPQSCGR
jgi:sarcosine oxidase gamma subunit